MHKSETGRAMGILLFLCVSAFLGLFFVNNEVQVILASPIALGMVAVTLVADLYLLRSLVRDWARKRD
jgi:UDP-N-acetylmuramyl pentapeptide phosphotransferase/UDP-N-acetylglucosamine-1-phosphate transferase